MSLAVLRIMEALGTVLINHVADITGIVPEHVAFDSSVCLSCGSLFILHPSVSVLTLLKGLVALLNWGYQGLGSMGLWLNIHLC